ncbi:MAG: leucyl aminopeptidase [Desulfovibrionaceae bacterium]|nr:leucyl aminopeptidase [Desulfovibrionaceae bacterium]
MKLNINAISWADCFAAEQTGVDAAILFAWEDTPPCECFAGLRDAPELKDFKGKASELALVYYRDPEKIGLERILLVGLGDPAKFSLTVLRMAAANAMRRARELKLKRTGLVLDQMLCTLQKGGISQFDETALAREGAISAAHALYKYDRFKTVSQEEAGEMETYSIIYKQPTRRELAECTAEFVQKVSSGVCLTKNLCNGPSNVITPAAMEAAAADVAARHGFKISVLREQEIREKGMGAYAAVFNGSALGGRLIILEWAPEGAENEAPLVFIGKGLTFDSGGISIKPAAGMHEMKSDMAGAAAVLGMCEALAGLRCPRRIIAMLACAENMPDGAAMRPGDIVTSLSGKTVEIQNTDAEGRLVLSDTLTYAEQTYKPRLIVDIATLTGACRVALGGEVAGMFCTDETLQEFALKAGQLNGDRVWPLPLWDEFFDNMKSITADMSNAGSREGGAINAALFLRQFISREQTWMHLDIAGPAYNEKGNALREPGATAFGLRLLLDIAMNWK